MSNYFDILLATEINSKGQLLILCPANLASPGDIVKTDAGVMATVTDVAWIGDSGAGSAALLMKAKDTQMAVGVFAKMAME